MTKDWTTYWSGREWGDAILAEYRRERPLILLLFLQLSGLQKYEDLLSRINAEAAQRLLNILPTVRRRFVASARVSE